MTRRRFPAGLVTAGVVFLFAACAPSRFYHHLEAQRWSDAAAAFAADSGLQRNERALFDGAMLHAMPGTPVHDPARSRELLDRLVRTHPRTKRHAAIVQLRAMVSVLERVAALEQETRELRGEVIRLREEATLLRRDRDHLAGQLAAEEAALARATRDLIRVESDLRAREAQVRALQSELDRLKAIDLRPPERPMATAPPPTRKTAPYPNSKLAPQAGG